MDFLRNCFITNLSADHFQSSKLEWGNINTLQHVIHWKKHAVMYFRYLNKIFLGLKLITRTICKCAPTFGFFTHSSFLPISNPFLYITNWNSKTISIPSNLPLYVGTPSIYNTNSWRHLYILCLFPSFRLDFRF